RTRRASRGALTHGFGRRRATPRPCSSPPDQGCIVMRLGGAIGFSLSSRRSERAPFTRTSNRFRRSAGTRRAGLGVTLPKRSRRGTLVTSRRSSTPSAFSVRAPGASEPSKDSVHLQELLVDREEVVAVVVVVLGKTQQ